MSPLLSPLSYGPGHCIQSLDPADKTRVSQTERQGKDGPHTRAAAQESTAVDHHGRPSSGRYGRLAMNRRRKEIDNVVQRLTRHY